MKFQITKTITVATIVLLFSNNVFSKSKTSSKNKSDETCHSKIALVENLLFADGSIKDIPKFVTRNETAIDFCQAKKKCKSESFSKKWTNTL